MRKTTAEIFLVFIFFMNGCDLLSTRDSEEPITQRSNFIVASTPDILIDNLKNSLKEKVVENYLACFVDESFLNKPFVFKPSAGAVSKFQSLLSWDLESERQYFNNLKASTKEGIPITLELTNEFNSPQIDSAVYQYDYSLTLSSNDVSVQSIYQGSLKFVLSRDSRNQWVITSWEDIERNEQPSWSELKGRFN